MSNSDDKLDPFSSQQDKILVNAATAAEMLSISPKHLFLLTKAGKVPSERVGNRRLYSVSKLRSMFQAI